MPRKTSYSQRVIAGGSGSAPSAAARCYRLLALLPVLCGAFAAPMLWAEQQPEAALSRLLPSACRSSGRYLQEVEADGLAQSMHAAGTYLFSCEHGLIWTTETPYADVWIYPINGSPLHRGDDGSYAVAESRVHRELGRLLNHLMAGDADYFQRFFTLSQAGAAVELLPKRKALRQFVDSVTLSTGATGPLLVLRQPSQQMRISIVEQHTLPLLDVDLCTEYLPAQRASCPWLFD